MQDYWIGVLTSDGTIEGEAYVTCLNDRDAVLLAALTATPFGHHLRSAAGFLAFFTPAMAAPTTEDHSASQTNMG